MKKYVFLAFYSLFLAFSLSAQTANELDVLLGKQTVTAAEAARFVLGAAELLPPELSGIAAETAAYTMALSNGWVKKEGSVNAALSDVAFLIVKAFELKGGVMYRMVKNPRYAYRELIYRRIIQGRADPAMNVSGQRLMQIIGRTLRYTGESELSGENNA